MTKLIAKRVIVPCEPEETHSGYVCSIFVRPKSDNTFRVILNLSELNTHIVYVKFKMETLHSVIQMMTPGCYMSSCDIKDAYYSVKETFSSVSLSSSGKDAITNTGVSQMDYRPARASSQSYWKLSWQQCGKTVPFARRILTIATSRALRWRNAD